MNAFGTTEQSNQKELDIANEKTQRRGETTTPVTLLSTQQLGAMIGDYEVGRIIGSGMIGVALVARHYETKFVVCLKCMSLEKIVEKNLADNIKLEIELMIELAGEPHIMPLLKLLMRE